MSVNTEKTRIVTVTDDHAVFAFLGFEFRWVPSTKTGRWYPCRTPRPKKITIVVPQGQIPRGGQGDTIRGQAAQALGFG